MPDPIDINRHLTRIQHLERARDTFAEENRQLLKLLVLTDQMVKASWDGNGVEFARKRQAFETARDDYRNRRLGPNP